MSSLEQTTALCEVTPQRNRIRHSMQNQSAQPAATRQGRHPAESHHPRLRTRSTCPSLACALSERTTSPWRATASWAAWNSSSSTLGSIMAAGAGAAAARAAREEEQLGGRSGGGGGGRAGGAWTGSNPAAATPPPSGMWRRREPHPLDAGPRRLRTAASPPPSHAVRPEAGSGPPVGPQRLLDCPAIGRGGRSRLRAWRGLHGLRLSNQLAWALHRAAICFAVGALSRALAPGPSGAPSAAIASRYAILAGFHPLLLPNSYPEACRQPRPCFQGCRGPCPRSTRRCRSPPRPPRRPTRWSASSCCSARQAPRWAPTRCCRCAAAACRQQPAAVHGSASLYCLHS